MVIKLVLDGTVDTIDGKNTYGSGCVEVVGDVADVGIAFAMACASNAFGKDLLRAIMLTVAAKEPALYSEIIQDVGEIAFDALRVHPPKGSVMVSLRGTVTTENGATTIRGAGIAFDGKPVDAAFVHCHYAITDERVFAALAVTMSLLRMRDREKFDQIMSIGDMPEP